jgi:TonB family protein
MKKYMIRIAFATSIMFAMTNVVQAQTKQSIEQKAREVAAKAKLEQAKRNAQREAEEKQWEAAREAQRKQEKYERSDKAKIESSIKKEFGEWCQKGEFEKQSDYEERLKSQSKDIFINICEKTIKWVVSNRSIDGELLKYDTEKEIFPIRLEIYDNNYEKSKWDTELKIPIAEAQDLKEESSSDYNWKMKDDDLYFIDNDLFSSKIVVRSRLRSKYGWTEVSFPLINHSKLVINFDDLKIDNPYLKGFEFDYSAKEQIFSNVEVQPSFPGGETEMMKWLQENISYPVIAAEQGIQGSVILRCVIRSDGSIENVEVQRSLDPSCDKEAVRVVKKMPKWNPGKQYGDAVNVYYTMPIRFRLQNN